MTHSIYRDSVIRSVRRGPSTVTALNPRPVDPAGSAAEGRRDSIDGRDLRPAGSAAEGRRGSIDGRDLRPAGSAAEGRRGSIDGRDLRPAGSAAEGRRGSIDGRDLRPAGSAAEGRRGSIDAELIDILDARPRAGETIEHAYRRKERELGERFAALSIVAAMALHKRLASPRPDDALARRFDRLVVERRTRLLSFLGDARRRAAFTGRR